MYYYLTVNYQYLSSCNLVNIYLIDGSSTSFLVPGPVVWHTDCSQPSKTNYIARWIIAEVDKKCSIRVTFGCDIQYFTPQVISLIVIFSSPCVVFMVSVVPIPL